MACRGPVRAARPTRRVYGLAISDRHARQSRRLGRPVTTGLNQQCKQLRQDVLVEKEPGGPESLPGISPPGVVLAQELLQCLVDVLAFLELSDTSVVDSDAALTEMESVAYRLQSLGPDDRDWIVRTTQFLADREGKSDRRAFVETLPDTLGLT